MWTQLTQANVAVAQYKKQILLKVPSCWSPAMQATTGKCAGIAPVKTNNIKIMGEIFYSCVDSHL